MLQMRWEEGGGKGVVEREGVVDSSDKERDDTGKENCSVVE